MAREEPELAVSVLDGLFDIFREVLQQVGLRIILLQELRNGVHQVGFNQLGDRLRIGNGHHVRQIVGGNHQGQLGGGIRCGLLDDEFRAELLLQGVQQGRSIRSVPVGRTPACHIGKPVEGLRAFRGRRCHRKHQRQRHQQCRQDGGCSLHVQTSSFWSSVSGAHLITPLYRVFSGMNMDCHDK